MPHEQPSNDGLNSPNFLPISFNMVDQKICIDHDLDEAESNEQCFELESVP